jgi:predicted solute-binding protein
MRLLIDDTLVTSVYTLPFVSGWLTPPDEIAIELVAGLDAAEVTPHDAALIPAAALAILHASHAVAGDVAVIAGGVGAIAMRTPVRADEVERTPVRLLQASNMADVLARATLESFYGITATAWVRDDNVPEAAQAEVVIVEGAEALREPEAGFSEDLSRAWFILTGQPVVSHLLLVPRQLAATQRDRVIALLDAARAEGLQRRGEWRPRLADTLGISRERAAALWAAQRLRIEATDRRALFDLLAKGAPRASTLAAANVEFIEPAATE